LKICGGSEIQARTLQKSFVKQFQAVGFRSGQCERSKAMASENPSRNASRESQRRQLARCADVLATWFEKWSAAFPTHEVSTFQIAVYAEALDDLSPEKLEFGCREATRTAEQFPKPGHVRRAAEAFKPKTDRSEFLGPALEWNVTLEMERIQRQQEHERALTNGEIQPEPQQENPKKRIVHVVRPLEEQKEELRKRGWLR